MQFAYIESAQSTFIDEICGLATIRDRSYALVIDDDTAITSVVLQILEMEGYAGLALSDGSKVLPLLQHIEADATRHLPSVILLDLMMPVMSGYEIAAHLARHPSYSHIPIIIMSADCRVRRASDVPGASDFIAKPFQINALLARLERYLSPVAAGKVPIA